MAKAIAIACIFTGGDIRDGLPNLLNSAAVISTSPRSVKVRLAGGVVADSVRFP